MIEKFEGTLGGGADICLPQPSKLIEKFEGTLGGLTFGCQNRPNFSKLMIFQKMSLLR